MDWEPNTEYKGIRIEEDDGGEVNGFCFGVAERWESVAG